MNDSWTIDVTSRGAFDAAATAQQTEQRVNIGMNFGTGVEDPANSPDEWLHLLDDGLLSHSGESVSPKKALSIPALYQAVSMISGDVAKIPLAVFRRRAEGGRDLFREHHAFKYINLVGMANKEVNAFKFWRRLMVSALLWNNGYAWIDRNMRGEVIGLYNLLPDRTTPVRLKGEMYYMTEVSRKLEYLPAADVFHLEGLSLDGFHGENLVKLFRDMFGQCLAKQKFSSKFFKNQMMAGGVLCVPPGAKPATVKKVQARIKQRYENADNAFKTLVLRDGYKWFSTQVDPQKGQMVESRDADARDVARIFNVKASRLSVADSTSYNADEMAIRDYHDGTLSHWLIGVRCEANAKLRTEREREQDEIYLDYKINALQWADASTRSEIANTGIQNGRWSPNETREWENLNPYEGGDTYYRPLNLGRVGEDEESDETNDSDDETNPDNDETNEAARQLAESTLKRAQNRLRIKRERHKPIDLAERKEVLEIITPACVVLGRDADRQLETMIIKATEATP